MTYNDSNIEYGSGRELRLHAVLILVVLVIVGLALKFLVPMHETGAQLEITEFTELADLRAADAETLATAKKNDDGSFTIPIAAAKAALVADPELLHTAFAVDEAAPVDAGDPVAVGKGLYTSKACFTCHSVDGSRLVGPSLSGLMGKEEKLADGSTVVIDDAYLRESIVDPMAKVVDSYPPAMPPQVLTDDELAAMVAYIGSLQ